MLFVDRQKDTRTLHTDGRRKPSPPPRTGTRRPSQNEDTESESQLGFADGNYRGDFEEWIGVVWGWVAEISETKY